VREFEAAHRAKKIAIKHIEPIGAQTIHKLKPDTLTIFTVPPSFDIWMERLHARGQMEPAELDRRLESAKRELLSALESDIYRFVINDTIEGTTAEVDRLVVEDKYDPFKEHLARETAEKLYHEVEQYLNSRAHRTLL
jgi:guanylate kinase